VKSIRFFTIFIGLYTNYNRYFGVLVDSTVCTIISSWL